MAIQPLRVLALTPYGEDGPGGMDRMLDKVRRALRTHPVAGLSFRSLTTRGPYPGKFGTYVAGPAFFLSALIAAAWLMAIGRVDVLHINLASDGSTFRKLRFAALARALGVPYVVHLHGGEYAAFWGRSSPRRSVAIRKMFEDAAAVIVLGTPWRTLIAANAPAAAGRIVVLPNATETPPKMLREARAAGHARILFLGRLMAAKGVPELVTALRHLGEMPGWSATLAGDGDVKGTRAAVEAAGLAERVDVPGWLDEAAVRMQLESADILVLPSHDEGLPVSIVEAFGYGLAVVTTPVGAIPDIVRDGVTGLLVPPRAPDALAGALRTLLADPALRRRLGENAQRLHRERLDLSAYVSRLVEIWNAAASDEELAGAARSSTGTLNARRGG